MRRSRAIASCLAVRMTRRRLGHQQERKCTSRRTTFSTATTNGHKRRLESNDVVKVTQHSSSSAFSDNNNNTYNIHTNHESMELVDNLLLRTSEMMNPHAANVVAYSGGVDSSLVAALVHRAFTDYDNTVYYSSDSNNNNNNIDKKRGSVRAVLGISHAVPKLQIETARKVADFIGIPLMEVSTLEGDDEAYIKNDGHACFVCKTHLYSTLNAVANAFIEQYSDNGDEQQQVILYNGTNADDTQDPTRLGLQAASNFSVHSPLDQITKDQVRHAAKYLGLSNWNAAASPCLRSRLAMGVMATEEHLRAVELAEAFVRNVLELDETINTRVRMLSGGKAMVELDNSIIQAQRGERELAKILNEHGFAEKCTSEWGFKKFGGVRGFKTGSVAAMPNVNVPLATATL
ncbi:hypothetical protein ACHAWC_007912 [Mediolabrus comicus]